MAGSETVDHGVATLSENDPLVLDLVDHLCNLVNHTLNKQLLLNWQCELVEVVHDSETLHSVIKTHVILGVEDRQSLSFDNYDTLVSKLDKFEDDIYTDFKLIILEVLLILLDDSYNLKARLFNKNFHHTLLNHFLTHYLEEDSKILNQYSKLLLLFLEFGVDIPYLHRLITPLLKSPNIVLTQLLQQLLHSPPQFKFTIFNNKTTFPFNNNEGKKNLTVYSWFKLNIRNQSDDPFTLFTISNSDSTGTISLTIQLISYNQFLVELRQNKATMRYTFNQILTSVSEYNQFVLTYDSYGNLNLFINGEYSESIPCPDINKVLPSLNKVTIGTEFDTIKYDELIIKNLTVLNTNLSHEWINLLFNLGLSFDWTYKELNNDNLLHLLTQLSSKSYFNLSLNLAEFRNQNTDLKRFHSSGESNKFSNFLNSQILLDKHKNKNLKTGVLDKTQVVNSLSPIKQNMILFDSNEFFQSFEHLQNSQSTTLEEQFLSHPSFLFHNAKSIYCALFSIGGSALLLKLLESSIEITEIEIRDSMVYALLSTLFSVIENDWRLCKEFENLNGYGILAIFLTNYRDTKNDFMTLSLVKDLNRNKSIEESTGCYGSNILNVLLSRAGFNFVNPSDSVILNKQCYRFLILNFDIFMGTDSFKFLLYHYQVLIESAKYSEYNVVELKKMRLLKRYLQFLKNPKLLSNTSTSIEDQIETTLSSILRMDPSVEAIKAGSKYIIFALYSDDCPTKCGVLALSAMTRILCDGSSSIKTLRKFSRSISIHWILLLLKLEIPEVTSDGLKLLTKLLKSLGLNIIKRFFQGSHGLEIITKFLRHWWVDDRILTCVFLAAFGIDSTDDKIPVSDQNLIEVLASQKHKLKQLIMPEFLLLLTNMILGSLYTLNSKSGNLLGSNPSSPTKSKKDPDFELRLNVLHVLNEYTESVRIGFENNSSLNEFYTSKEFLEGFFEILANCRLITDWSKDDTLHQFKRSYTKISELVTNMMISKLPNNQVMEIFDLLNDLTKNVMLEFIFPGMFSHINEFITVSNFIFNEKGFLESIYNLLACYQNRYLKLSFLVSDESLKNYLLCVFAILELDKSNSSEKLRSGLGDLIIVKILRLADHCESTNMEPKMMNDTLKLFLYRQMIVFLREVLNRKQLAEVITILLGTLLQLPDEIQEKLIEYTFSFFRTLNLMNQDEMSQIVELVSKDPDLILEFMINLSTKNDDETFQRLKKYPTLVREIVKKSKALLSNYRLIEKLNLVDMMGMVLHKGGRLGDMENVYVKGFERDCEVLRSLLIQSEVVSYNRAIQDHEENLRFLVSGYNNLKIEMLRLIPDKIQGVREYTLDFIENHDRIRKRLVAEDQLPEGEKLAYNFTVPIRQLDKFETSNKDGTEEYDMLLIDTLGSLNLEGNDLSNDDEVNTQDENIEGPDKSAIEDKNRKVIRSLYLGDQITSLWNVSEINGLVPVESLMILGTNYLYLIENYFHCADGNVAETKDAPSNLRDPILQLVNSQSSGVFEDDYKSHRNKNWNLEKLSSISKRLFLLRDIALEMFFSDGASILITCLTPRLRDTIYNKLHYYVSGYGLDSNLTQALQISTNVLTNFQLNRASYFASKFASAFINNSFASTVHLNATKKWKQGELSNFYYLMIINTLAGRTFNDLSQYPVFPWVIADYESEVLDLSNPNTFRDLSKPMGAQSAARAAQFKERYEAFASLQDDNAPPCHYGTHYSSAMIVTSYLIRMKPFVQSYLLLQGGKFDHADRLFNSIERAWRSASQDVSTDVRELTPEFFYLPEFLTNSNNFEFGKLQNGKVVNDVELPPWAKGDANYFVAKNREALESPYVSQHLNEWIDLIFGYKQGGVEAVNALNVFHPVSYNGAINLDNITDEVEKRAIIGMINNFGQTPFKIFEKPHVSREILNSPNFYLSLINLEAKPQVLFESKLKAPIEKLEISSKVNKQWIGRPQCIAAEDELLIRKPINFRNESKSLIINQTTYHDLQLSNITYLLQIGNKCFLTGGENGTISIWKSHSSTLQFQGVLRGHFKAIKSIKYSKSFKIGVSCDTDGFVIVWDLVRFKFIRKLDPPENQIETFISISNDIGNIAIVYYAKNLYIFKVFSINGSLLLRKVFDLGVKRLTCVNFATINDPTVDTSKLQLSNDHTNWSNDIIGVAMGKELKIYEIIPQCNDWYLQEIKYLQLQKHISGDITALEIFKRHEVDYEEKLCRGVIKIIIGDFSGRVYSLG